MAETYLSVIIPAYNEAQRISQTLDNITNFLSKQPYAWEIIVIDDGSSDETSAIASKKLTNFHHVVLKNLQNRGKGYVVRQGMLHGKGKYLLFTDADLSTPIEEINGFIQSLQMDYDLVIGSRGLHDSRVEIHQNFMRENMGKIFNLIARLLSFHGIHDSQCGFKCFKHTVAKELFGKQKLNGFSFDAEIVYLAQKLGYRILEAPVTWRNSPQTRVRFQDPFFMLFDLLRIRWIHRHL